MKLLKPLFLLFVGTLLASCGSDREEETADFSLNIEDGKTEFRLGETLTAQVKISTDATVDSIVYFLHDQKLQRTLPGETMDHTFQDEKLGRWNFSARIYSGQTSPQEIAQEITLYNDSPPVAYTYNIIATYPHSPNAYTQGLEFHEGKLYESTGQYGSSSLRKVNFRTGEVLEAIDLDDSYFGEGITILDGMIYQLTWKSGIGFIYDVDTFEKTGEFSYDQSKEGWGLANDGEKLYKSDGTEKIWLLNKNSLAEETYIQTLTHRTIASQLNELEWVEGKIYANTYQKDGVAIINPRNGAIEGIINFQGLRENLTNTDDLDPVNDVLNGIAYDPQTKKLYVTGKRWDKLFEVEITEK